MDRGAWWATVPGAAKSQDTAEYAPCMCDQALFFFFGGKFLLVCEASASHEQTVTTVKGVSAFLYMRRHNSWLIELIKSALEIIYLKTRPASFPGAQGASLLSTLDSFRGCWRSAAAAAHDPIFVEADGKRPGQVPIGG